MITVSVFLHKASQPIKIEKATNTYQKGSMFCVQVGESVLKYPLQNIFLIVEDYGEHTRPRQQEKTVMATPEKEAQ